MLDRVPFGMRVVVAALVVQQRRVLVAQRAVSDPLALKWEFPGGKVEPGETPEVALARELQEEFGVEASIGAYVTTSDYDYGAGWLRIHAYRVNAVRGAWERRVHADLRWVTASQADALDLLPADVPILQAIRRDLA